MLGATSLLVLFWFWPEIRVSPPPVNDEILHLSTIEQMDEVWAHGGNVADFWSGSLNFGHAFIRSYQPLMHLVIWLLHKTVFSVFTLQRAFAIFVILTAMSLPWTFYYGLRNYGLPSLEACVSAVAVVLVHESEGFGIGLSNFTFAGHGTYTQLLATAFFPLAVGWSHRTLLGFKLAAAASVALAATMMSHIVTGYIACIWIALDAFLLFTLERIRLRQILLSAMKMTGITFLLTCHWIVPLARDQLLQRHSDSEPVYKWIGHGAKKMLADMGSGAVLDTGRLPVLTLLAATGFLVCIIAWFQRPGANLIPGRRHAMLQVLLWVPLSFGPKTWGSFVTWLPFSNQLHWHRFVAGAQIALIICAGIGVGFLWRWVEQRWGAFRACAYLAPLMLCALVFPCLRERSRYFYETNALWLSRSAALWEANGSRYMHAVNFALQNRDARYYVGHPGNWGKQLNPAPYLPFYALLSLFNVETVGSTIHHQSHTEVLAYEADVQRGEHNELMNVRYLALPRASAAPPGYVPLITSPEFVLYDNGNRSGYFIVGTEGPGGCADNDTLARATSEYLKSDLPGQHVFPTVFLAGNCVGRPGIAAALGRRTSPLSVPGGILASGRVLLSGGDSYWADVTMKTPGLLVFKMSYHPGWIAVVNNREVRTLHVLPGFVGIRLDPGNYAVQFTYKPDTVKRALLWVSLVSLGSLCVVRIWSLSKSGLRSPVRRESHAAGNFSHFIM